MLTWLYQNQPQQAQWLSARNVPAPKKIQVADDTLSASAAYKLACEGTAILWQGDYHQAKQLLQAMARRFAKPTKQAKKRQESHPANAAASDAQTFHLHRQAQAQRARILGMLLVPLQAGGVVPLRRAPDVRQACEEGYGEITENSLVALSELQGMIGAHEWRKKGVYIEALDAHIHPFYSVFSPVRGEYLQLVNEAPLPDNSLAFDIGTGTGVLAAILAKRGVRRVIATDIQPQALACAAFNLEKLGYATRVTLEQTDMFPQGKAPLIVCNPPWLPVRPSSAIERAIYDENSQMLCAFLSGLNAHLTEQGEGWLILSDFAEHLGLRGQDALTGWIQQAGLVVVEKTSISPRHSKVNDADDPLHEARVAERTSLYRLRRAG